MTHHTNRTATRAPAPRWGADDLQHIRQALGEEAERLRGQLESSRKGGTRLAERLGEVGDDAAGLGTLSGDLETETCRADHPDRILLECEHALERIADGRYGRCESCGKAIAKARLRALPRATHCLACPEAG